MKPGRVVYIRVNPQNCMTAVDIFTKLGYTQPDTSFDAVISVALSAAFQLLRENGVVPTRQGFEFEQLVGRFTTNRNKRKLLTTQNFDQMHMHRDVPTALKPIAAVSPKEARLQARFDEIIFKKMADKDNFSQEEEDELNRVSRELGEIRGNL